MLDRILELERKLAELERRVEKLESDGDDG